jgi:hypothetical protein
MRCLVLYPLLALMIGCSTTRIVTTDPSARIYVDGAYVGQGRGAIRQRGRPHTAQILVKADDGRTARDSMKRSFTWVTLLGGIYTYGVGLLFFWEYPDTIFVPLPTPRPSGWDNSGDDVWLRPPPAAAPR